MLFQVIAPHFCAGIVVEDGEIVAIAPIIAYMKKWDPNRIYDYVKHKGWKINCISP